MKMFAHLKPQDADRIISLSKNISASVDIAAVAVFGSVGRGTAGPASDLDIIFIIKGERPSKLPLYKEIDWEGQHVDLNLMSVSEMIHLSSDPGWQYRILDTVILEVSVHSQKDISLWLRNAQEWIRSPEARIHRISCLRDNIVSLMRFTEISNLGMSQYVAGLIAKEALFLACEVKGLFPFTSGNPISTLASSSLPHERLIPWRTKDGEFPTGVYNYYEEWKSLDTILAAARRIVFPVAKELHDGESDVDVFIALCKKHVILDMSSVFHDIDWLDSGKEDIHSFAQLTSDRARPFVKEFTLPTSIIINREACKKMRLNSARFSHYDEKRKRFKVVIPTGGCRAPGCVFCALPSLARFSDEDTPATLIPELPNNIEQVTIYTDGSFFDDRELSPLNRIALAQRVKQIAPKELMVETLPKFLDATKLDSFISALGEPTKLRIAFGLQTTNVSVRENLLRTPITSGDFETLLVLRERFGFSLRIYLLIAKPMMTSKEDEQDILASVELLTSVLTPNDKITINHLRVVQGTFVGDLRDFGLYEPRDLCRTRRIISKLRRKDKCAAILPGCISVDTCTYDNKDERIDCGVCRDVLEAWENEGTEVDSPCTHEDDLILELPWRIFGSFENRMRFTLRMLAEGSRVTK